MKNDNAIVPPGISGKPIEYHAKNVTLPTLADELALLTLGNFEPLNISIDCNKFMKEIEQFKDDWVEYLPKVGKVNNRQGLVITNLEGKTHRDNPSQGQAIAAAGRLVTELEFKHPTAVYDLCPSLHKLIDYFSPVGRTFLVKLNKGGHFVPHRDHPGLPTDTFRVAVFLNNCGTMDYDWIMGADNKVRIDHGQAYYINTRVTHRTISWVDDSIHLIMNIPMTNDNVSKLIGSLKHNH